MTTATATLSAIKAKHPHGYLADQSMGINIDRKHTLNAAFRCPIPWPARETQPLPSECDADHISSFIKARYLECLWLGERFFPLATFVAVFGQMQGIAMSSAENRPPALLASAPSPAAEAAHRVLLALSSIFKPREFVQRRYREVAPRRIEAFVLGEGSFGEQGSRAPSLEATAQDSDFCPQEVELIRIALRSGSGSLVADEIQTAERRRRRREEHARIEASRKAESGDTQSPPQSQSESQAAGLSQTHSQGVGEMRSLSDHETKLKLRDEWLAAIERRELSLQILLILEALRLSSEFPAVLSMNNAAATMDNGLCSNAKLFSRETAPPDALIAQPMPGPSRPAATPLQPLESQATVSDALHATHSATGIDKDAATLPSKALGNSISESGAAATKKRKRKSTQARRWTGISSVLSLDGEDGADGATFPWEKRPFKPGADDQEDDRDRDSEDLVDAHTLATDPERLHRRFESLVDRLSLRIVTADLAKDLDFTDREDVLGGPSGAGSPSAADGLVTPGKKSSATAALAQSFGTSARVRDERDERDELHFLCSDIVEPRFSRMLPRQCALLRSRATGGGTGGLLGGSTPARPTRGAAVLPGSVERQRLAHARKEADLLSKKKAAEERARAREAQRASQRPALKDALVLEEKSRMGRGRSARASSITADAERNKREVSVNNRVRTGLARSASTSSAVAVASAEAERDTASQTTGASVFARSASSQAPFSLPAPLLRPSKRKTLEPQRIAGRLTTVTTNKPASDSQIAPGPSRAVIASQREEDPDEDNPFRDSSQGGANDSMSWLAASGKAASVSRARQSQAAATAQAQAASSQPAPNNNRTLWGVGRRTFSRTQTHAQPSTQSQGSAPVARRAFVDERGAAIPDGKAAGTWQRTESQPVTQRDLSDLGGPKRIGQAGDDGSQSSGLSEEEDGSGDDDDGEDGDGDDDEPARKDDEAEEEEEMLISRRDVPPRTGHFLRIGSMGVSMGMGVGLSLGRGSRTSTPNAAPAKDVSPPAASSSLSSLDRAMAPQAQGRALPLPGSAAGSGSARPLAVPSGRNPFAKVSRA